MKRRILAILIIAAIIVVFAVACGEKSTREPGDPAKALFITQSDASQRFALEEFQRLKGEFDIEVDMVSGENDLSAEIAGIDRAISEKYDVIFINSANIEEVLPALKRAKDAGIIVGLFSSGLPSGQAGDNVMDFFCGSDEFLSGITVGEFISAQFPDGANVVEVGGPAGHATQIQLHNGFAAGVADNINILASQNSGGGWSSGEARQIMEIFLTQYGDDIDIVWCHWDDGAYGVIEATQAAGRYDIFIIGVGGNSVSYQNVLDGLQQLSVSQNYSNMVRRSLQNARTLLDGGSVSQINIIPMDMITPDTINNFAKPEW